MKPKELELQKVMLSDDAFISPELQAKIDIDRKWMADQVKSKMSEEQKELLETSNILNESSHELKRAWTINFMKN